MRKGICNPRLLEKLLEETGHSAQELSEVTEIPIATIRGYLSGKRDAISTRNMLLFAQFFQMPMPELVDYFANVGNIDKK